MRCGHEGRCHDSLPRRPSDAVARRWALPDNHPIGSELSGNSPIYRADGTCRAKPTAMFRASDGPFLRPSEIGLDPAIDGFFSNDDLPIAHWMGWEHVQALKAALEAKYGPPQTEGATK